MIFIVAIVPPDDDKAISDYEIKKPAGKRRIFQHLPDRWCSPAQSHFEIHTRSWTGKPAFGLIATLRHGTKEKNLALPFADRAISHDGICCPILSDDIGKPTSVTRAGLKQGRYTLRICAKAFRARIRKKDREQIGTV